MGKAHLNREEYDEAITELGLAAKADPKLAFVHFNLGVAFMKKHHARIPYLHLKSVDGEISARVAAENIPFAKAVAMDMFVEPSRGKVDFLAFRDALREIDYVGYGIVEQDMFPAPFDKPLPIAKRTRAYLREIGLG